MDRDRGAAQADAVSPLQGGGHADSARLLVRLRREEPPAKNGAGSADLLQQPPCTPGVRSHVQRLARGQNPATEPDEPRSVHVFEACRERRHRRRDSGRRLPSQRPNHATHLETIRSRPKRDSHGAVRTVSATREAARDAARTCTPARGGARARSSASRLPGRRLSNRRLSTFDAVLLRVNPFRLLCRRLFRELVESRAACSCIRSVAKFSAYSVAAGRTP